MEDFFRELEECLRGEVSEGEIRDSINYYRQYFAEQKAAGYGEKEILDMLGSPRLIARSIIDARGAVEQNDSGDGDPYYDAGQLCGCFLLFSAGSFLLSRPPSPLRPLSARRTGSAL